MAWLNADPYWKAVEASMTGKFGPAATEDPGNLRWTRFEAGRNEIFVPVEDGTAGTVIVRMLNSHKDGIIPPSKLALFAKEQKDDWRLVEIKNAPNYQNTKHDAFIDFVIFSGLNLKTTELKIAFTAENKTAFDQTIIITPQK